MPGQELHHVITIQGFHIDVAGHVNNAAYHQWMDETRTKLLAELDFRGEHAAFPALARTEIDYLQPLTIGDRVHIVMWLSTLRRASADVQMRFYNGRGVLCARAMQKTLFVRADNGLPWRIPAALREALSCCLVDS